jgi:hypothetical protein
MRDSGLAMVFMGAESGSLEVLQRMNKGGILTPDKTLEIAARMRAFEIVPELCFVLGNPPDPELDIDTTFEFVRKIKKVNPDAEIILYLYSPVPLTGALTSAATHAGFRFPETLDEWISADWQEFSQHRTARVPWLTGRYRDRIRDFQKVLHATYPTITDPRLTGAKRAFLQLAGTWRYRLRFYRHPLELRALGRWIPYQRPEISGF